MWIPELARTGAFNGPRQQVKWWGGCWPQLQVTWILLAAQLWEKKKRLFDLLLQPEVFLSYSSEVPDLFFFFFKLFLKDGFLELSGGIQWINFFRFSVHPDINWKYFFQPRFFLSVL